MAGDDKEESSGSDTETEETERGNIIHLMLEANLIPYIQKCHDLSVKDISHRACFFHTLYMMVFMVYTLEEYVNSKCSSSKVKVKYLYFHTNTQIDLAIGLTIFLWIINEIKLFMFLTKITQHIYVYNNSKGLILYSKI